MDKKDKIFSVIVIAAAFLIFANALGGEFVYDDLRQIVRNPLIQESALYGKAIFSDVWAFKGDGTLTASNYWRPTFTAFHILNFAAFGLKPFGWHLLNILLHTGVCGLIFALLRRWDLEANVSFIITLIFAVHPVHVETVAWISGSPDLLFALFFLVSLWFADQWLTHRKQNFYLVISLLAYLLALGAKETAMLCFPIYFLLFVLRRDEKTAEANAPKDKKSAASTGKSFFASPLNFAGIYFVCAASFFIARWIVLGQIAVRGEQSADFFSAILSLPEVFVFYLRQIVFPFWLGANYPPRPVAEINFTDFLLPLIVSAVAVFGLWKLARRSTIQKIGLAVFVLPLLPAFNISAFVSDQIVHDRYLYLSLFGFLLVVIPALNELSNKFFKDKSKEILLGAAVVIALLLATKTFFYNPIWANNFALWQQSLTIDPNSPTNLTQFGAVLSEQKKYSESLAFYNRAVEIKPTATALSGRARDYIFLGQYDNAVRDLDRVIAFPNEEINAYTLYQAYEARALADEQNKQLDQAAALLREARQRLPIYRAALTEKLAVVLYQQNKKNEALRELETMREAAKTELLPESKDVILRLGMLYSEAGQTEKARAALREYLDLTANFKVEATIENRKTAANLLKNLR